MATVVDIAVEDIKLLQDKGSVKALAKVRLNFDTGEYITQLDWKVIHQADKAPWVAVPSYTIQHETGNRFYRSLVETSRSLKAEIEKRVLEAYNRALEVP
jgi:DNA-binding cell septation regulator SpoVG